jgi:hypothetical protein
MTFKGFKQPDLEYHLWHRPEPQLQPIPETTRGFRIRVDLRHMKPPIWRRIEVSGGIRLPDLHDVLQAAVFDSAEDGRDWLPEGWHPEVFDLEETNELIALATAPHVPVTEALSPLRERSHNGGAHGSS